MESDVPRSGPSAEQIQTPEAELPDMACPIPPEPWNERERLQALLATGLLDTPDELPFDRLTHIAARMLDVPICLVSLVDQDRQWFKSKIGLEDRQTPRKFAFCAYAILETSPDVFVVNDAALSPLFKNNPLVTGPPFIRFYAGAPLILQDGIKLGTLCVIDKQPRSFSIEQKMLLQDLAAIVVSQIHLKRELSFVQKQYISATSHNLRTPLAALQFSVDYLKQAFEIDHSSSPMSPRSATSRHVRDSLSQAESNISVMKWSIDRSIAAAREHFLLAPEVPNFEMFTLQSIFEQVETALKPLFKKSVPVDFASTTPVARSIILNDRASIYNSLVDLVTNAIQNTKQGSIAVTAEAFKEKDKIWYRVDVTDTGSGVPDEVRERLFKVPFVGGASLAGSAESDNDQLWKTRSGEEPAGSAGLGCYNIRIQMEKIGGRYGFCDNPLGGGSKFWIEFRDVSQRASFPVLNVSTPPTAKSFLNIPVATKTKARLSKGPSTGMTVLVVDDSAPIRHTLGAILKKCGFDEGNIDFAENGQEGLTKLKESHYDLAFVDFLMPLMNGIQAVYEYRLWEADNLHGKKATFIVGFSCNAEPEDTERGLAAGMNVYKNKPMAYATVKEIAMTLKENAGSLPSTPRSPVLLRAIGKGNSQGSLVELVPPPSHSVSPTDLSSTFQLFLVAVAAALLGWLLKSSLHTL